MPSFPRKGATWLGKLLVAGGAGVLARIAQRPGAERIAADVFSRRGFHLLRKHYYVPIPDEADLAHPFGAQQTELVGIEIDDPKILGFLEEVAAEYMDEFRSSFPLHSTGDPRQFYLINGTYMAVDAQVYYAIIRHFQPKRIVEIGSGNSTLLAAAAGIKNAREGGRAPDLTAIEPYPNDLLKDGFPGLTSLVESRVQDVPLSVFTSLEAGDILFIDSSHVLRAGGDVQLEYLEILPRLAPGVLVHVHDISLPKAYPPVYFESGLYWNEQYLLQAFLAFNHRFEVVWPGNYMMIKYPERVSAVFPEFFAMREAYPQSEPTAFWMQVRS